MSKLVRFGACVDRRMSDLRVNNNRLGDDELDVGGTALAA